MRPFAWIVFLLLFISCSKLIDNKKPNGVLDEAKMVSILVDIHLSEGRANIMNPNLDSARLYFAVYKDSIFKKNKVTKFEFDSSYNYYMRDIASMDKIYMAVVDSLSLRQGLRKLN